MPLELRDQATGKSFEIPDEGATFGREGGTADLQFKDGGVSKRHARIFLDGDAWFIEDLNSSNGTYLQDERIAQSMELMPGDLIGMSKLRFEVVGPVGAEEPPPPPKLAPKAAPPKPGSMAPKKPAPRAPPPDEGGEEDAPPPPPKPAGKKPTQAAAPKAQGGGGDDEIEDKGIGYFFVAVPKATFHYLAAIPLMLVNPVGSIRKGIEEQPHDPKGRMELIAYALPPLLFSALLSAIALAIVGLIHHTFSIMMLLPIGPIIGAVIGAAVTGFIWHPLTTWIINFLKGESDARSRTNYFMMTMTATAVLAVPNALAIVLGLVPFRLIAFVGPVLATAASLVMTFIHFNWLKHFNTVKWAQMVVLVLGVLTGLGGLASAITTLLHPPVTAGSAVADAEAAIAEAQKAGEEAQKAAAEAQADAKERIADAKEKSAAAQADAKEKLAEAKEKAQAAAAEAKEKAAEPKEKPAAEPKEKPAPPPEPAPAERVEPPPSAPVRTAAVSGTGYPAFAQMREAIEKRVTDDPTILTKNKAVLELYRDYESDVFDIEAKYQKLTARKPSEVRVNAHLRDAEIFEKTEKKVKELYGKLK